MQKSHKERSKCKLAKPRVKIKSVSKHQQTTKEAFLVHHHVQDSTSWCHSWVPATCWLHTHKYGRRIGTTALCPQRLQTDSWEVSSSQTEQPDRDEVAQGNTENPRRGDALPQLPTVEISRIIWFSPVTTSLLGASPDSPHCWGSVELLFPWPW